MKGEPDYLGGCVAIVVYITIGVFMLALLFGKWFA